MPVHGSMYKHLWSNGPKECLEFPDYTFEQHFGEPVASYPPRLALRDYLLGYTKHHKIDHNNIRLSTCVKTVVYHEDTKKFEVTAQDAMNHYKETFDHVIVASGHFSTPNSPDFKGLDQYSGLTLHSHDFRTGEAFAGQTVAVVGGSYSAEDIASQLFKFGAKNAIITHRIKDPEGNWKPKGFIWPKGIEERPLMTNIENDMVTFGDGSVEKVDSMIFCTGYKHHFPFLDKSIRLTCPNKIWIKELTHGCISKQNDKMFYLGMQDQFYTYNFFASQSWYVRDIIMGKTDASKPLKDTAGKVWTQSDFDAAFDAIAVDEDAIKHQGKYSEVLMVHTGYGKDNVDAGKFTGGINNTLVEWEHLKEKDIMGYRNYAHASLITGKMAPKPTANKDWLSNKKDDGVEFFKNLHK